MRSASGCRLEDDGAAGVKNSDGFLAEDDDGVDAGAAKRGVALNFGAPPCCCPGTEAAPVLRARRAPPAAPPPFGCAWPWFWPWRLESRNREGAGVFEGRWGG